MAWTFIVTILLALAHLFGVQIGRRLDAAQGRSHSFGAGMAFAYVFLHVLPELEKGQVVLGHQIHLIVLGGFTVFYGIEHWIHGYSQASRRLKFWLRIGLHSIYNWIIIYTLPEAIEVGLGYTLLLALGLGLHLVGVDYHLYRQYPEEFESRGRYVLTAALIIGWTTDLFFWEVNPYVADIWIALLSGFVLYNVFREEAPEPGRGRFLWITAGIIVYTILSVLLW